MDLKREDLSAFLAHIMPISLSILLRKLIRMRLERQLPPVAFKRLPSFDTKSLKTNCCYIPGFSLAILNLLNAALNAVA